MSFSNTDNDEQIERAILNDIRVYKRIPKNNQEEIEEELDLSVMDSVYNSPVKCYLAYRETKRRYEKIYNESPNKYYYTVCKDSLVKYVKTALFHKILSLLILSAGTFFFYYFGLSGMFSSIWHKIKSFFIRKSDTVREL